jgi:hypothetical protein
MLLPFVRDMENNIKYFRSDLVMKKKLLIISIVLVVTVTIVFVGGNYVFAGANDSGFTNVPKMDGIRMKVSKDDSNIKSVEVRDASDGSLSVSTYNKKTGKMTITQNGKKILDNYDILSDSKKYDKKVNGLRIPATRKDWTPNGRVGNRTMTTPSMQPMTAFSAKMVPQLLASGVQYIGGNQDILFNYYYDTWYVSYADYNSWQVSAPLNVGPTYYWDVWDYEKHNYTVLAAFANNVNSMSRDESTMLQYYVLGIISLAVACIEKNLHTSKGAFVAALLGIGALITAANYSWIVRNDIVAANYQMNSIYY